MSARFLLGVLLLCATATRAELLASPTRLWLTGGVAGRDSTQRTANAADVNITGISPTVMHLSVAQFFHRHVGVDLEGRGEVFVAVKDKNLPTERQVVQPAFDVSAAAAGRFFLTSWLTLELQLGWGVSARSSIVSDASLAQRTVFFTGPSFGVVAGLAPLRAVSGQVYARLQPWNLGLSGLDGFKAGSYVVGVQASLGALRLGDVQLGVAASVEFAGTSLAATGGEASQRALRLGVGLSAQRWMEDPAVTPKPEPSPPLRGHVVTQTGEPVAGAVVTLDDSLRANTDAAGAFAFSGVPRGKHRVSAKKEGRTPAVLEVAVPLVAPLVLELGPATGPGRIVGVVRAGSAGGVGPPVAGAQVLAVETQQLVKTNADGRYTLERVGPGPVTVQVRAAEFTEAEEVVQVPPGAEAVLDLVLTPKTVAVRATLRGLIRAKSGELIKAMVRIVELKLKLQVKPDGRFTADVPSGKYTLIIEARGFVTQTKTIEVSGGDQAIFHAELEPLR